MASRMLPKIIGFVLRPFARPIRYGALKVMKRIRRPDDKRPMIAAANHILEDFILPSAFRIFTESKFRELALFSKLPVSEHDRIFNELEVAGVCLALFYFEVMKPFTKPGDFHFWREVEENLTKQLQRKLMGYGVDSDNVKLMRQLIDMRYSEYKQVARGVWTANDFGGSEFGALPPEKKHIAVDLQAIAVGTADHIRRGKIKEGDPLIKHLVGWLLDLYRTIGKFVRRL